MSRIRPDLAETGNGSNRAWLASVVSRASTLEERRHGPYRASAIAQGDAAELMELWKDRVAGGDSQQFEQHLAYHEMTMAEATQLLAGVEIDGDHDLPPWTEMLAAVSDRLTLSSDADTGHLSYSAGLTMPFPELLQHFVAEADGRVAHAVEPATTSPATVNPLRRILIATLGWLAGPTLVVEYDVFRSERESSLDQLIRRSRTPQSDTHYRAFVAEQRRCGMRLVFDAYPALARALADVTAMWVEAVNELFARLGADASRVAATLCGGRRIGRVRSIDAALGDRHNRGRSVLALEFESGSRIVYKPRSVGQAAMWSEFVSELDGPIPLRAVRVVPCDGYGWVEYIEPDSDVDDEAAAEYYHRAGALLAALHVLGATDCHYENLISVGAEPVLVDCETLLHHSPARPHPGPGFGAQVEAARLADESVLRVGLLPDLYLQRDGRHVDQSGLAPSGGESARSYPTYEGLSTDELRLANSRFRVRVGASRPVVDGEPVDAVQHREAMADGFETMLRYLSAERHRVVELLGRFENESCRYILRATQIYSDLLQDSTHPELLRDGARRSIHFSRLARRPLDAEPPAWLPLVHHELEALSVFDVPVFTAPVVGSRVVAGEEHHDGILAEASLDAARRRLAGLDEDEIGRQLELVVGRLEARAAGAGHRIEPLRTSVSTTTHDETDWIGTAVTIGELLEQNAITSDDGSCTWIGPEHDAREGMYRLLPLGSSFYGGTAGVSLFLSALYDSHRDERWRRLAAGAVAHIAADAPNDFAQGSVSLVPGGVAGSGGTVYCLVRIAAHLDDDRYLEIAERIVQLVEPERIAADAQYDVCHGNAGAVLGYLALASTTGSVAAVEKARMAGDALLDARTIDDDTRCRGWVSDGRILAGMSHGSAGIALALARLGAATNEERFSAAAIEALDFERALFDPTAQNWPRLQEHTDGSSAPFMVSWCHGAPGIAMARAGMAALGVAAMDDEIKVASATTARHIVGPSDTLCCGNLGRADALLTAGTALNDDRLVAKALEVGSVAAHLAETEGGFAALPGLDRGAFCPGFHQGFAGIGYMMLRLHDRHRIPSALLWDT